MLHTLVVARWCCTLVVARWCCTLVVARWCCTHWLWPGDAVVARWCCTLVVARWCCTLVVARWCCTHWLWPGDAIVARWCCTLVVARWCCTLVVARWCCTLVVTRWCCTCFVTKAVLKTLPSKINNNNNISKVKCWECQRSQNASGSLARDWLTAGSAGWTLFIIWECLQDIPVTDIAWMYLHGVPVVVWVMHPHHVGFTKVSTGCRCYWRCMTVPAGCTCGCMGDASSSCRFHESVYCM